jgi:tetratricopeptide (TPR) repeat protein
MKPGPSLSFRPVRAVLIAIVAVACASRSAEADEVESGAAPTVEQLLGPEAFARYAAGKARYDVQDYAAAIAEFRAAYQLNQHPVLVFALAKAQQKHRDCAGAIESLRRFIRGEPGPDWVARAEQEIERCEVQLREEREQTRRADERARRREAWRAAVEETRGRAARRRRWSYAIAGTGAAMVAGAAVATGVRGHHLDEARRAPTSDVYLDRVERADGWTTAAIVLAAAGGAAVAGGIALWLTAPSPPAAPTELRAMSARIEGVAIAPSGSGASVLVGGSF